MTKREMAAKLIALGAERDELKEALTDALLLLVRLGAGYPHQEGDDCLHCAYILAAAKVGAPLKRYMAEERQTVADFAQQHPERHALLVRGVFEGGVDLLGGDVAAGGGV